MVGKERKVVNGPAPLRVRIVRSFRNVANTPSGLSKSASMLKAIRVSRVVPLKLGFDNGGTRSRSSYEN